MRTEDYADSDADLKLSEVQLFFRLTSQILNLDKNVVIATLLAVEKESASACLRSKMCFPTVCFQKLETSLDPGSSYTFGFSSSVSLSSGPDCSAVAFDRALFLFSPPTKDLFRCPHPLDSSGDITAQFLGSLQRSLDPDNLDLASRCFTT